jgi:hypothetical protein
MTTTFPQCVYKHRVHRPNNFTDNKHYNNILQDAFCQCLQNLILKIKSSGGGHKQERQLKNLFTVLIKLKIRQNNPVPSKSLATQIVIQEHEKKRSLSECGLSSFPLFFPLQ